MSGEGKAVGRELFNLAVSLTDAAEELIELGFEDLGTDLFQISDNLTEHAMAMFRASREED